MSLAQPLNLDGKVTAATGAASGLGIELCGATKRMAREIRTAESSSAVSTCMTGQMLAPDGGALARWDKQRERNFT